MCNHLYLKKIFTTKPQNDASLCLLWSSIKTKIKLLYRKDIRNIFHLDISFIISLKLKKYLSTLNNNKMNNKNE